MNRKSTLFSITLRGKPEDAITEVLAELLRAPDVGEQVLVQASSTSSTASIKKLANRRYHHQYQSSGE